MNRERSCPYASAVIITIAYGADSVLSPHLAIIVLDCKVRVNHYAFFTDIWMDCAVMEILVCQNFGLEPIFH